MPRRLEPLGDAWQSRWIWIFLALGAAARLVRYLLRFPLEVDEAMLAMNFLDRGYRDLLHPLDFAQVAPVLFVGIELTAVKLLGFSEFSLRLFPLVCSLGSLLIFRRLALVVFRGTAAVLAVAVFAVSYPAIRYAAEVKPYESDLAVSLVLLTLAVQWWRRPDQSRWLWILAAATPVALGLSFPAVFVAGGVSLVVAAVLGPRPCSVDTLGATTMLRTVPGSSCSAENTVGQANRGTRHFRSGGALGRSALRGWRPWIVYNLALVGSFASYYILSMAAQASVQLDVMREYWDVAFPPRDSVGHLLAWLVRTHAGPLLAQPIGGDHFGSTATLLLCLVAAVVLWRRARYRILLLLAAPLGLTFVAAALRRYPYGGHMRLAMHVAPLVCLAAGFGAACVLGWMIRPARRDRVVAKRATDRPVLVVLVLLLLLGVGSIVRDVRLPAKSRRDLLNRDFSRWFWNVLGHDRELVSIKTDLGLVFPPPGVPWRHCSSPQFLCNERIQSPRIARGEPPRLDRVSHERPLACVQYWNHVTPYDRAAMEAWLEQMKTQYDLKSCTYYPLAPDDGTDESARAADRIEVYEFVPKTSK